MRSIMHAYSAVHSTDVKKELDSGRDQISEMRLTQLTDSDLVEVAEEILEGLFAAGFSVAKTQSLLESVLIASDIPGRQQKIERLQEAFITVVSKVREKSARTAIESFAEYRHSKSVNEAWVNKFETDKGNVRLHESLVAQDRLTVKTGLLQMLEKAKAETPAAEEEEEREDDELFGSPNKKKGKKKSKDVKEDKKYGYDKKGRSLNPADVEERKRKKDDLFGSPNVKKEETELAEKQKDTPDQVKAVIAYDKARKGTDDAVYDTEHGKKKQAKKERDYAKWQRDKGAEDAQKSGHPWEHAKGSTREKEGKKSVKHAHIKDAYEAVYESGSAIKDPGVKGSLKKELKDLRKGIKGNAKGIKDADEVSQVGEDKNWIQGAVKRPGAFTKKAKEAGMSVQQFAAHVDKNKSKYSTRTERQANLAQTFAKMKKEGYDFDAIQESLTKEGYPSEEVNWVMANGI